MKHRHNTDFYDVYIFPSVIMHSLYIVLKINMYRAEHVYLSIRMVELYLHSPVNLPGIVAI
jgi:hypothetical protein